MYAMNAKSLFFNLCFVELFRPDIIQPRNRSENIALHTSPTSKMLPFEFLPSRFTKFHPPLPSPIPMPSNKKNKKLIRFFFFYLWFNELWFAQPICPHRSKTRVRWAERFRDELNGHVFDQERNWLRQVVPCPLNTIKMTTNRSIIPKLVVKSSVVPQRP